MTRQEWMDEAARWQKRMDEAADDAEREVAEAKRDACLANSVYGTEEEEDNP